MKKMLLILVLICSCFVPLKASTRGVGCTPSNWYTSNSSSTSFVATDSVIVTNNLNNTQVVVRTLERTKYSSVSLGGNLALRLAASKLNISFEVNTGNSQTVSTAINITVEPHTSVRATYGSNIVTTSGNVYQQNEDCSIGHYSTRIEYTYEDHIVYNYV